MSMQQFLGCWECIDKTRYGNVVNSGRKFEVVENGNYKMTNRDPLDREESVEFKLDEPIYVGFGCIYTYTLLNNMLIVKCVQENEDMGIIMHYYVKNDQLHHASGAPGSARITSVYKRSGQSSCSII